MPKTFQFDPKDIELIVAGKNLVGFADGTFVTCRPIEDRYSESVGAQGDVTRNRNRDPRGEIQVTLKGESPSHDHLHELGSKDDMFGVRLRKVRGQKFSAGGYYGWLRRKPDKSFGDAEQDTQYTFVIADYFQGSTQPDTPGIPDVPGFFDGLT